MLSSFKFNVLEQDLLFHWLIWNNSLRGDLCWLTYIIASISEIPIGLCLLIVIENWFCFWVLYRLLHSILGSPTCGESILQGLLEVSFIVLRSHLIIVKYIYVLWSWWWHIWDVLVLNLSLWYTIMGWKYLLFSQMIFISILSLILNEVIRCGISGGFRIRILWVFWTCCLIHVWNILYMAGSSSHSISTIIIILRSISPCTLMNMMIALCWTTVILIVLWWIWNSFWWCCTRGARRYPKLNSTNLLCSMWLGRPVLILSLKIMITVRVWLELYFFL